MISLPESFHIGREKRGVAGQQDTEDWRGRLGEQCLAEKTRHRCDTWAGQETIPVENGTESASKIRPDV